MVKGKGEQDAEWLNEVMHARTHANKQPRRYVGIKLLFIKKNWCDSVACICLMTSRYLLARMHTLPYFP